MLQWHASLARNHWRVRVCKCEGRVCSGGLQWRASRSSRGVRKEGLKMEGLRHCGDDGNHTGKIEHLAFL